MPVQRLATTFQVLEEVGVAEVAPEEPCWERLSVSVNLSAWARVASWGGVGAILR